jgi:hypothetical protein
LICFTRFTELVQLKLSVDLHLPLIAFVPFVTFFGWPKKVTPACGRQEKKASQFEYNSHYDRPLLCELAIAPIIISEQSIGATYSFVLSVSTATAGIFRE